MYYEDLVKLINPGDTVVMCPRKTKLKYFVAILIQLVSRKKMTHSAIVSKKKGFWEATSKGVHETDLSHSKNSSDGLVFLKAPHNKKPSLLLKQHL